MRSIIVALFIVISNVGCSVKYNPNKNFDDTKDLSVLTQSISPFIDKGEANILAKNSISYSYSLIESYKLVSPPSYHNYLVNEDIKQRGLCHHFAADISQHLQQYNFKTIDIRIVVANKGEYLEHSAVYITAKNENHLKKGVILDGWRNSGKLFFSKIDEDKQYNWKIKRKVNDD